MLQLKILCFETVSGLWLDDTIQAVWKHVIHVANCFVLFFTLNWAATASHCVEFFLPVKVKSGYEDLTGSAEAPARLWWVVNGWNYNVQGTIPLKSRLFLCAFILRTLISKTICLAKKRRNTKMQNKWSFTLTLGPAGCFQVAAKRTEKQSGSSSETPGRVLCLPSFLLSLLPSLPSISELKSRVYPVNTRTWW